MASDANAGSSSETYAPHDCFPDGVPVVIRLMPGYSVDVPLFPRSDFTDALVPGDLLAKLIRWQKEFDHNYHWETGWRSTEVRDRWAGEAVPLEASLRDALRGKADLVVDLWPLPWSGPRP
jgi:hypothetical protein